MILSSLIAATLSFAATGGLGWLAVSRRRSRRQERLLCLHQLAEQILGAPGEADIVRLLGAAAADIFGASEFRLYRFDRPTRTLHRLSTKPEEPDTRIALGDPAEPELSAVYETGSIREGAGRLLLPLAARAECLGVLELRSAAPRHRAFSALDQTLARHIATVVAAALRVQDQQVARDRMRRGEQIAMAGQLISAIANELREPLDLIRSHADHLLARELDSLTVHELSAIRQYAAQSGETLARLIGFARTDRTEVSRCELNAMVRNLIQFRSAECLARGIECTAQLNREPLYIEGVRPQLEEAILQLLFQAELAARSIVVQTQEAGGRAILTLQFANPAESPAAVEDGAAPISLCRSLIQAHGGTLEAGSGGFSIQLPRSAPPPAAERIPGAPAATAGRPLTILLIEPDEGTRRKLLAQLGEAGHRVVPISSGEEGLDLLHRMRFDAAFCAARLPGIKWLDFFETARHQLSSFILLAEGFDASLGLVLRGAGAHILRKPVVPEDLQMLLEILSPAPAPSPAPRR